MRSRSAVLGKGCLCLANGCRVAGHSLAHHAGAPATSIPPARLSPHDYAYRPPRHRRPLLDGAIAYYEQALGLKCEHREEVPAQKVRTAFFAVGEVHLELLEPTSPESPVAKFLEKNGEGIHHVAYATTDLAGQLQQAARGGVKLVHEKPFEGAAGKLVAFLHPKSTYGVLTEFCMEKTR